MSVHWGGRGLGHVSRKSTAGSLEFPQSLFTAGRAGGVYEISPTTCFTDTTRATAAVVGNAVKGVTDLSGTNNHWSNATDGAVPILRQDGSGNYYLEVDGSNDSLTGANSIALSPTMTVVGGCFVVTGGSSSYLNLFGFQGSTTNYFHVAGRNNSGLYRALSRSSTLSKAVEGSGNEVAGALDAAHVVVGKFTVGENLVSVDGGAEGDGSNTWADDDSVAGVNTKLWLGPNAGWRFYGGILGNWGFSAEELEDAMEWVAERAGVSL